MKKRRFCAFHLFLSALGGAGIALFGTFLALYLVAGPFGFTFLESLRIIRTSFVGEYDAAAAVDQALAGLVDGLGDRWSYYCDAQSYTELSQRRSNTYIGIGITVSFEDERGLKIEAVAEGGSAEQAGLHVGEMITAVDGTSIAGEVRYEASDYIQGQEGTTLSLTILEESGEVREVVVNRVVIAIEPVESEMLEGQVGYVRLKDFHTNSAECFHAAVEDLISQGARALLFDVRDNGGGYVSELTQILDPILPEGPIFRMTRKNGDEQVIESDEACIDLPMVVLVNRDSYSAAEFFAAQLQEMGKAKIVGETTSGKGYSQQMFPLPNGGALGISTGRYTTGNGVSLVGTGVSLDAEVTLREEERDRFQSGKLPLSQDPQVQKALELLLPQVSESEG